MPSVTAEQLSALPSLAAYPPDELAVLLTVAKAREVAAREDLCREGDPGRSCFLVVAGALDITKMGSTAVLATLGAGTFVGQMALVDHAPRSATVTAREPTVVLEFAREPFERLLAARSPLALRFQEQIAIAGIRQLRQATARLVDALGQERARESTHLGASAPSSRGGSASGGGADRDDVLRYIQAAANEWDLDLEKIEVVRAEGEVTAAEAAARRRARG
jgi:CRP/FNR family cyclic AMP-dependent transcriptional regulator